MNEVGFDPDFKPGHRSALEQQLGARLVSEALKRDPNAQVIEDSFEAANLASGDTHDYRGSLDGGSYLEIADSKDKLVTEFGIDAPPSASSLQAIPEAAARLAQVMPRVAELHDYQYHLLKFYIEHYRIQKYAPNAGYFQFMWIDFSPQSFYGVYDYWGHPKAEGLRGALRALKESNQPIGVFLEHDTKPKALYAVNDSSAQLGNCIVHWRITTAAGLVAEGSQSVNLSADSVKKIRDLTFEVNPSDAYRVVLSLADSSGKLLATNSYDNAFHAQTIPVGYSADRLDHDLGMRLWWAPDHPPALPR